MDFVYILSAPIGQMLRHVEAVETLLLGVTVLKRNSDVLKLILTCTTIVLVARCRRNGMNYVCEQESICYALILLSLICCIHSETIIHHFSRDCRDRMINTGKQQL
jgi:hypothetical protein